MKMSKKKELYTLSSSNSPIYSTQNNDQVHIQNPSFFKKHNKLLKAGVLFGSLALGATVLEGVGTYIFNHTTGGHSKALIDVWTGAAEVDGSAFVEDPYCLFWNRPNRDDCGFKQTNSMGFRNEEFPVKKPKGQKRIALLGSSTTYATGVDNPKDAAASKLENLLKQHYNQDFLVINAGLPGATTAEEMNIYIHKLQHLDLDVLIINEGGNDAAALFNPNYDIDYKHFRVKPQITQPRWGEVELLKLSGLARCIDLFWLKENGIILPQAPRGAQGLEDLDSLEVYERTKSTEPTGFKRNLQTITQVALANNTKVMYVPFLLNPHKGGLSIAEYIGKEDALILAVDKHRKIMQEMAKKYEVGYIELDQSKFQKEWFTDWCHLFSEGETERARQLYEGILKYKLIENETK